MIKIQNNEIEVLDPKMQGEDAEAKNGTLVKKFGKKRNTGSGMKRSTRFEKIYRSEEHTSELQSLRLSRMPSSA